jgi:hypothetical protein
MSTTLGWVTLGIIIGLFIIYAVVDWRKTGDKDGEN